mmetsp:Transcript_42556/g.71885  ORF Transcript_42556/g.71885 Transcript_42556/m.71885 type:complete len:241 (+) Transcript_42556:193-915(+)
MTGTSPWTRSGTWVWPRADGTSSDSRVADDGCRGRRFESCIPKSTFGEVSEWFKVRVLKTTVMRITEGSNPSFSGTLRSHSAARRLEGLQMAEEHVGREHVPGHPQLRHVVGAHFAGHRGPRGQGDQAPGGAQPPGGPARPLPHGPVQLRRVHIAAADGPKDVRRVGGGHAIGLGRPQAQQRVAQVEDGGQAQAGHDVVAHDERGDVRAQGRGQRRVQHLGTGVRQAVHGGAGEGAAVLP